MSDPYLIAGGNFSKSRDGIARTDLVFYVPGPTVAGGPEPFDTLNTYIHSSAPFGLPIVNRVAQKQQDGSWELTLTYEGAVDNGPWGVIVELDHAGVEDPIETFPEFAALRKKYKGTLDERNNVIWPATLAKSGNNTDQLGSRVRTFDSFGAINPGTISTQAGGGSSSSSDRNPMLGVSHFLNDNVVLRITYSTREFTASVLQGICKICTPRVPPGLAGIAVPPAGKSWLKRSVRASFRGNIWQFAIEYYLGIWSPDIYGAKGGDLDATDVSASAIV